MLRREMRKTLKLTLTTLMLAACAGTPAATSNHPAGYSVRVGPAFRPSGPGNPAQVTA